MADAMTYNQDNVGVTPLTERLRTNTSRAFLQVLPLFCSSFSRNINVCKEIFCFGALSQNVLDMLFLGNEVQTSKKS